MELSVWLELNHCIQPSIAQRKLTTGNLMIAVHSSTPPLWQECSEINTMVCAAIIIIIDLYIPYDSALFFGAYHNRS